MADGEVAAGSAKVESGDPEMKKEDILKEDESEEEDKKDDDDDEEDDLVSKLIQKSRPFYD